ncbi:MAG: SH3 domain-containing protein [Amaricoccus sp.]|uniref:SH3 domain-containing protein n=1 Tax=Amaricoccus sp. TaxID=1872485 RepID=UPI0039E45C7E
MDAVTRFSSACGLVFAVSLAGGAAVAGGVGTVTSLPIPRFVSLRAEEANARRGPSLDQRVDWEFVHQGLPLEVTAEYGQWRRVQDADGMGGWVHHALLSGVRTALVTATDPVPLRAGPEDTAAVRGMAEPGAIGRLESCAGAWCEFGAGGVSGWLPRTVLWGVGPDETVK